MTYQNMILLSTTTGPQSWNYVPQVWQQQSAAHADLIPARAQKALPGLSHLLDGLTDPNPQVTLSPRSIERRHCPFQSRFGKVPPPPPKPPLGRRVAGARYPSACWWTFTELSEGDWVRLAVRHWHCMCWLLVDVAQSRISLHKRDRGLTGRTVPLQPSICQA